MGLEFWLLDITYTVVRDSPEVVMYGITRSGERVTVTDGSFRPYFYVLGEVDPSAAQRALSKAAPIEGVEAVERRYFGRPTRALRVVARRPPDVRELREVARSLPGAVDVLEADIRFYMRYMIDTGVLPSAWNMVEVDEGGRARAPPTPLGDYRIPRDLRVMAFDIEVYNPRGSPDPSQDPIVAIAVATNAGHREVFAADGKRDRDAIRQFVEFVKSFDPDVVLGYNSNGFDWPYLTERARKLGVRLDVSRSGTPPEQSVYGHWSIVGRANFDVFNVVDEMPEIKVKTLDRVAEYFGVMRRDERTMVPPHKIHEYWDDPSRREVLIRYAMDDAVSTLLLGEKMLPFAVQLSAVTGLPLDQVFAASVGARVEWLLMRYAYALGELAPNREERPYESYKGAMVLEPRPGIHLNVAVLDFTSMYPNLMIKYNISPDTYLEPWEDAEDAHVAPEVGHRFRKTPQGFFPRVLTSLIELRREAREALRSLDPHSTEYLLLDERQRALKLMANAMYGYSGWIGARWYKREVAETVTAYARRTMTDVIRFAQSIGLEVIYGDTDSLFVRNVPDKVDSLVRYVEESHGIEIKLEKIYRRVLFTEAKKRYAGLLEDGRIDIVGFEVVRGDWCELAKEVQLRVIEIILGSDSPSEAAEKVARYVKDVIDGLKKGRIQLDDLIIWKTLDKDPREYRVLTPHLHAANLLRRAGYRVGRGTMVGYVIVKGGEKVTYRAKPYILVQSLDEVDVDYYVERQIVPAALRIAAIIGVTEADLKGPGTRRSLLDYL